MDSSGIMRSLLLFPTNVSANEMPIIPTAWTLPYEVFFYLAAIWFVIGKKKVFYLLTTSWFMFIIVGQIFSFESVVLRFLSSTLFLEFYLGLGVAWVLQRTKKYVTQSLVVGVLLVVFNWMNAIFDPAEINYINRLFKFGIPFTLIIYGLVGREMTGSIYSTRGWHMLSESSFSLYLVHYPLLIVLRKVFKGLEMNSYLSFILSAAICIGSGAFCYLCLERPIVKVLSNKMSRHV